MDFNGRFPLMNRRAFLARTGVVGLAGLGLLLGWAGCGGDQKQEKASAPEKAAGTQQGNPCDDPALLDEEARITRTTFKYQSASTDPTKVCTSCNFWHAPAEGASCGTCTLVKGPISPQGSCMSWVKAQQTGI